MNWLAHLLLSRPTSAFRVGNLLPDLLTHTELRELPAHFLPGTECHRRIDRFTDSHWAARQSIARIDPPYRRFGGILIDVFYDHLLANDWSRYSAVPLGVFAQEMYAAIKTHVHEIPPHARPRLQAMLAEDWLCSYREIAGVRRAVEGIGKRLRKPVVLELAVDQLAERRGEVQADFERFFPELVRHLATDTTGLPAS